MKSTATPNDLSHRRFLKGLLALTEGKTALQYKLLPSAPDFLIAQAGIGRLSFRFVVGEDKCRVELYIDRDDAKTNERMFDELLTHKREIQAAFGDELSWERLEGRKSCRVSYRVVTGGVKDDESTWPPTQIALVDAMAFLERALLPFIPSVKLLI